jgi:uncharacterized paraquat-inducible protein A
MNHDTPEEEAGLGTRRGFQTSRNRPNPNLDPCPACHKPVSITAELCPHCGHRLKKKPQSMVGIVAAVMLALIIAWFLGFLF